MNLLTRYPERQWSEELRRAVEAEQRRTVGSLSAQVYGRLIDRREWLEDERNPPWNMAHYQEWEHHELVWRVVFLQGCSRRLWVELGFWRETVVPVVATGAVLVGLILGLLIGDI